MFQNTYYRLIGHVENAKLREKYSVNIFRFRDMSMSYKLVVVYT